MLEQKSLKVTDANRTSAYFIVLSYIGVVTVQTVLMFVLPALEVKRENTWSKYPIFANTPTLIHYHAQSYHV